MTKKKDKPKKPETASKPPSTNDPPLDPDARNLPPAPAPSSDEKDDLQQVSDIESRPPQAGLVFALLLTSEIRFSEIVAKFAANPDDGERLVNLALRRLERAAQNRGLTTKEFLSSLVNFIMELEGALKC